MTETDLMKLALDDIRARQKALSDQINAQDQQTMALLRLYVTLGVALASAALATLFSDIPERVALGMGLAAGAVPLSFGVVFCFRAAWTSKVAFTGRDAVFWEWAFHPKIQAFDIRTAYFKAATEGFEFNRALNSRIAKDFWNAKWCGVATPLTILVVAGIALGTTVPGL